MHVVGENYICVPKMRNDFRARNFLLFIFNFTFTLLISQLL